MEMDSDTLICTVSLAVAVTLCVNDILLQIKINFSHPRELVGLFNRDIFC